MSYYLYILQMSTGQLYVGTTSNLPKRFQRRLIGNASKTTSALGVEQMLYTETHADRMSAEKRERQIKSWSRAKKIALIRGEFAELRRLSKRKKR